MSHTHHRRLPAPLTLVLAFLLAITGLSLSANPAAADDIGYVGPSYGGTTQPSAPTAQKPQSKLWYAQGRWWGALWDTGTKDYYIWQYDPVAHQWQRSGTTLETRTQVDMDVLWDGSHLYVLSSGKGKTMVNPDAEVSSYSFDAGTNAYRHDWGPVKVATGLVYSPVIDKDSTGTLWVTFTQGTQVMVTHSAPSDPSSWGTPYLLPTPNGESTVTYDPVKDPNQPSSDISAVVAFDGDKVGVLWSNQRTEKMYWASHIDGAADGAWTLDTAYAQPKGADDHINLKSIVGDPSGRVYAVAKTSSTTATEPLINLLVLGRDGTWTSHVYSRVSDNATRAIVMIDREARELYVFSSAPCCSGGNIYYKKTTMDSPNFEPGLGTVFMQSATNPKINNPTSSKQTVDSASDLMVLASDDSTRTYLYNTIDLQPVDTTVDTTAPDTTLSSTPAVSTTQTTATFGFSSDDPVATFRCTLDSLAPAPCTSPTSYSSLATGQHTFSVQALDQAGNADATPASFTWTVTVPDTTPPETTISSRPASFTMADSAQFGFSSDDPTATFSCRLDSQVAEPCTSPKSYAGLVEGTHTFTVTATDQAGNTDLTPATYTWTRDVTAPNTRIDAGPDATTTKKNAQFKFSSTESGSTFQCKLDAKPLETCATPQNYSGLTAGAHSFSVAARDRAGNLDTTPATFSWTVR